MTTIDQTKTFDRASRASAYATSNGLTEGQFSVEKHGKLFHLLVKAPDTTEAAIITSAQADTSAPAEAPKAKGKPRGRNMVDAKGNRVAPTAPKGKKGKAVEAKGEKAPRAALEEANGIKRPKAEGQTGQVWAYCDEQHKKTGAAPTRADALADLQAKGINFHTVSTQYGRWRKFMGISGRLPKAEK